MLASFLVLIVPTCVPPALQDEIAAVRGIKPGSVLDYLVTAAEQYVPRFAARERYMSAGVWVCGGAVASSMLIEAAPGACLSRQAASVLASLRTRRPLLACLPLSSSLGLLALLPRHLFNSSPCTQTRTYVCGLLITNTCKLPS